MGVGALGAGVAAGMVTTGVVGENGGGGGLLAAGLTVGAGVATVGTEVGDGVTAGATGE